MLIDDMPQQLIRQVEEMLGARIRPAASAPATIVGTPFHRIDDPIHEQLRQLRVAALPAGSNTCRLVHIWETYESRLPPRANQRVGPWTLRHVTSRPDVNSLWYNQLTPGLHLRLPTVRNIPLLSRRNEDGEQQIWMSSADLELATMSDAVEDCTGHVLVAGLGLGLFPTLAAQKTDVKSVTVLEIDPDITTISAQYVDQPNVTVINDSIENFAQHPPTGTPKFDYCFVDIWPAIQDPYAEEHTARATVSPLMAPGATVSVWCQALNDRKRASMQIIRDIQSAAVEPALPDATCYQCAQKMASSIAGLCIECALGTWHESHHLQGEPFPIQPHEIPEIAFVQAARNGLIAVDPDLITAILDGTAAHTAAPMTVS